MSYTILSVGFDFPGGDVESISLESDRSLRDSDIVVFRPAMPHEYSIETYKGKPSLTDESSFRAREALLTGHQRYLPL